MLISLIYIKKLHIKQFGFFLLICVMLVTLAGCMVNYGRFVQSREAQNTFESNRILQDHKYYYHGSKTNPDTIVAIHKNYTFDFEYWHESNAIEKDLKFWVRQLHALATNYYFGYYILGPDGNQIGLYYSTFDFTDIKLEKNNRVIISVPYETHRSFVFTLNGLE